MKKLIVLVFALLLSLAASAQDTTVTVYFKSGQSKLDARQAAGIEKLKSKPYTRISLDGYADRSGKVSFNQKLSYKRAAIAAKSFKPEAVKVNGRGVCSEKISASRMRKVVIRIWYEKPAMSEAVITPKEIIPSVKRDSCKGDTTLSIDGTLLTINKCFYLKQKDCFKYKTYRSGEAARLAGLRTVDEKGNPIESGGMFDLAFCKDTCLTKPVVIYMPVPSCLINQPMTLWTNGPRGSWKNSRNKLEIVKLKGVTYYRIEVFCSGRFNCDRCTPPARIMKVRLKNGMKFKSAEISNSCPITSFEGKISKNKKVARFPYLCGTQEHSISIKASTKQGDTLVILNQPINTYKRKRRLSSNCFCSPPAKEKVMGVFRFRKRMLYRKYKVYRKDFK
jgi:hypothetical protein